MDLIQKLRLRVEYEKKQSCLLYQEKLLTNEILRTYTTDTLQYLSCNYSQDYDFVQTLNRIIREVENSTRILCLNTGQITNNANEQDTAIDLIFDETQSEDIFDTLSEFDIFDFSLPSLSESDLERSISTNLETCFCHIGYKIHEEEIIAKQENQDFIISKPDYLIVCDGVGSGRNSKQISSFVAKNFSDFTESFIDNIREINRKSRSAFIQQGTYIINQQLINLRENSYFDDNNSGTTLSSIIKLSRNNFHISTLGDSPVYLFDMFMGLSKATNDDTLFNKLLKQGFSINNSNGENEVLSALKSIWANVEESRLLKMANNCIVKSFGFKHDSVTFNEGNNFTLEVSNTAGLISCTDGISDQFQTDTMYSIILIGAIKEMIYEFKLEKYAECFGYSSEYVRKLANVNITDFFNFYEIQQIYRNILNKVFTTYGFHLRDSILKGGIKELANEALLTMQGKRRDYSGRPYFGFNTPKSDNIAIGYIY